uniref:Sema domain-containing protein n=1 Tax=Gopherus evgoodei TaxID=1825980 RepID=A0A8C4YH46_9SAUR
QTRTARPFAFAFNTSDYRILLVDQDQDRLYLGARDYLVALDLHNVNKDSALTQPLPPAQDECFNYVRLVEPVNRTHLYVCGTGAWQPVCAMVHRGWRSEEYLFRMVPRSLEPGKGRCPYDPRQSSLATLVNGTLYAGLHVDFMGTDAAIFRTRGPRAAVRTEQHDSRWLYDPVFLRAHVVPDSSERSDDKLYFFFRERALEGAVGPGVLARVGRVCLNDDGGQRALVSKWTTFLKAQLVCSVMGEDGVETFFDELRDIFLLPTQDEKNPRVYGLFSTLGSVFQGSAVCVYPLSAIRSVFNGPFAHKEGRSYQWVPYTGRVPYPRPGAVSGGWGPGRLGSPRLWEGSGGWWLELGGWEPGLLGSPRLWEGSGGWWLAQGGWEPGLLGSPRLWEGSRGWWLEQGGWEPGLLGSPRLREGSGAWVPGLLGSFPLCPRSARAACSPRGWAPHASSRTSW